MLAHLPAELLSAVGSPVATVKGSDTLFAAAAPGCGIRALILPIPRKYDENISFHVGLNGAYVRPHDFASNFVGK